MKISEFFRRWKEGIKNLSPRRQLYSKMMGEIGMIFGLSLAGVFLILRGMWFFIIVIGFGVFLQIISLIGTRQQYAAILQMEETLGNPEQNKEGDKK